jgi:asparagine synthase (glutamine-hydrolysing)
MCGIGGFLIPEGGRVEQCELDALAGYLAHRGPNGKGTYTSNDRRVGLVHTRLSILDLTDAGSQPMTSRDGRYVIVFNGEIYNFTELARELEKSGVRFQTKTDTEVLLYSWQLWGKSLLPKLNGMWAFAIFDTLTNSLVLCRDRFGVKPLYYTKHKKRLIFASEAKAIDAITDYQCSINPQYLLRIGRRDVGEISYIQDVYSLPAGHLIELSDGIEQRPERWYRLPKVEVPNTFSEQCKLIRSLVVDACHIRLRSDVPVATCPSGGIDSGSIVSVLNHFPSRDTRSQNFSHRSFNAAFPGTSQDEWEAARSLADSFGCQLDSHVIAPPSPEQLEESLLSCDGPMPCLAFYPIWKLYNYIKNSGVRVTLDGMGPDECLGGYYIGVDALRGAFQLNKYLWMRDLYHTYGNLYEGSRLWIWNDFRQLGREIASKLKSRITGKRREENFVDSTSLQTDTYFIPASDSLSRRLQEQFFLNPLPYQLHQYDRCSMANGVEARFPFMDFRFVETVFSLPLQSRIGNGYTKRILREAMKGILPDQIRLKKKKIGFNAPFREWRNGVLGDWMKDIANSTEFTSSPYFDGKQLSQVILNSFKPDSLPLEEWNAWLPLHTAWLMTQRRNRSLFPTASPHRFAQALS